MPGTLNSDIHPMTLAVGPATIAGNTRGVEDLLVDMLDEEEAGEDLLNIATETILDYIRTLASAGATYIYVADPVASLFSPAMYERFVLPCHRKIFGLMKELGIGSRLHMCGDTTKILPFSSTCGADIVDIDHAVNFAKALEIADGRCLINGNIDPVADVFSCDAAHTKQAILNAPTPSAARAPCSCPAASYPPAPRWPTPAPSPRLSRKSEAKLMFFAPAVFSGGEHFFPRQKKRSPPHFPSRQRAHTRFSFQTLPSGLRTDTNPSRSCFHARRF